MISTRGKAQVYEEFGNPALLGAVRRHLQPGGAVLDVGCASGGLLAALADVAGRREGIELDPVAATNAGGVADAVHVGAVGDVTLPDGEFDVIVLGDVLEHLVDPSAALERIVPWLADDGRLVISLPNVAHWTVRVELLAGRWEYRESGILDDTHLRFFTWASGIRLVDDAGLVVIERKPIVSGIGAHLGRTVPRLAERAWQMAGHRRPGLFAFQQLIVARRP